MVTAAGGITSTITVLASAPVRLRRSVIRALTGKLPPSRLPGTIQSVVQAAPSKTAGAKPSPASTSTLPQGALPVPHGDRPLPDILEDLERQLIERAYEKAKKVKTESARLLGIKTSALYYKLEKYGFIQKCEAPTEEP